MKPYPSETTLPSIDQPQTGHFEPQETRDSVDSDFDGYFERHWASIYRLLERMLGDADEAEDVALEAFYRLHQTGPHLDQKVNIGGWLYRVALNLGLHALRSARRRSRYEAAGGQVWLEAQASHSPLEIVTEREDHERARAALARMNPRHAQLLLLRYSGKPYKDIAATLHLSVTSIGPLLLRAEREFEQRYRALAEETL